MSNPDDYAVGWICAIATEYVAAQAFLDEKHEGPNHVSTHDNNHYTLGRIGKHNVVIAVLPHGEYGVSSAATVGRDMLHSFPNVRIGLMVGIAGGAPSPKHDIRLGDVVVSASGHGKGGVLQYDFGKAIQGKPFQETGVLNQPPPILRAAVHGLMAEYEINGHDIAQAIDRVLGRNTRLRKKYTRPDASTDRLYLPSVLHPNDEANDATCAASCPNESSMLQQRLSRTENDDDPAIHYGLIASSNKLIRDAIIRDSLASDKGILCFEMESAGLMNHFPCLVIRGICDYADSHKNKEWQGYAAMTAAAYAKDPLHQIHPDKVEAQKKISQVLSDIQACVSETSEKADAIIQHQQARERAHERKAMLDWLTPIDYAPQQGHYINMRQPGTCEWFLNSEEYQTWLETNSQTLFCPGPPGSGKTILTATVVDDIYTKLNSNNGTGLAYLYCDYRRQNEQNSEQLLANLLKQLSHGLTHVPGAVKALCDEYKNRPQRPTLEDLSKALYSVSMAYSRVFIVVDALDECQIRDGCRQKFLVAIGKLREDCRANIFITSRENHEILEVFKKHKRITAHDQDVQTYLAGQMDRLPSFIKTNLVLQNEIKESIATVANGMFLLARLHIDSIVQLPTVGDIRTALRNLPEGLVSTYEQAMARINIQEQPTRELAMRVLQWLVHAKRVLSIRELRHAVAIKPGQLELDQEFVPEIQVIGSICAGLVTIDNQRDVVRLAHYTTHEYFQNEGKRWLSGAERRITAVCVTYLSYTIFESGPCESNRAYDKRLDSYWLYKYSACHWGHHAYHDETSSREIISFLQSISRVGASCQVLWLPKRRTNHAIYPKVPGRVTGMHLAGFFGLRKVMEALLVLKHNPDPKDTFGRTPLWYAADKGHDLCIKLLLKAGAAVNAYQMQELTVLEVALKAAAHDGHVDAAEALREANFHANATNATTNTHGTCKSTALAAAAAEGHLKIVEMLLEAGADPNSSATKPTTTALEEAAGRGNVRIAEMLIEAAASVNAAPLKGPFEGIPLHVAAGGGHLEVVKMLLKAGATVHAAANDHCGYQSIYVAAWGGHLKIVAKLLKAGVDVNFVSSHRGTALQAAATGGHMNIAQMLLQAGADVNAVSGMHTRTALQTAAHRGHLQLVEKLLEAGADVNTPVPMGVRLFGQTALKLAARGGYLKIVEKLLEAEADVNAGTSHGETALQAAAAGGHINVAKKLLQAGADVNADANHRKGRTALQAAAEGGHLQLVEELLQAGANINSAIAPQEGRTALQAAAEHGHLEVVEKLLKEGSNVNASPAECGYTALQAAAAGGHLKVAEKLLQAGAEVDDDANASVPRGLTPLQVAAKSGHLEMVETLLAAGASINANAISKYGRTALQAAAEEGHLEIAEKLLALGANVNSAAADQGCTALQAASRGGHLEMVEKLLAMGANVNAAESTCSWYTPLQEASGGGHVKLVEKLLDAGANVNAAPAPYWGYTALQAAAKGGHIEIVEKLLAMGADVNAAPAASHGRTALQAAAEQGDLEIVEKLIAAGANVNAAAAASHGRTAIRAAALRGHIKMLKKLLAAHDITGSNSASNNAYTAFRAAVQEGNIGLLVQLALKGTFC